MLTPTPREYQLFGPLNIKISSYLTESLNSNNTYMYIIITFISQISGGRGIFHTLAYLPSTRHNYFADN